jgi:hypothetical protein
MALDAILDSCIGIIDLALDVIDRYQGDSMDGRRADWSQF